MGLQFYNKREENENNSYNSVQYIKVKVLKKLRERLDEEMEEKLKEEGNLIIVEGLERTYRNGKRKRRDFEGRRMEERVGE